MSIAAKQLMLRDVEKNLGVFLTVEEVRYTMQVLTECLSIFDVEQIEEKCTDAESDEYLTAFLDAKRVEGRAESTIDQYDYIINRMYEAISVPIKKISVFHLRSYFAAESARGISNCTLNGVRSVIVGYFNWLQKEGLLTHNPTINLNPIKDTKKVLLPYTTVDIEKLKEACKTNRNKAIISILLSTGCRIGEICRLNRTDINFATKEIIVLGKGKKERTVFIDDVTSMLLQRYLSERSDCYEALFIGKGSKRLTASGIRKMLHAVANIANVENTHPHRFRRTLATNLNYHGMPIQEVAAILGHEKLDTTMKYVYINKSNVKTSYYKYVN